MVLERFKGVPQEFIEAVAEQEQKIHELKAELERYKKFISTIHNLIVNNLHNKYMGTELIWDMVKEFEEESKRTKN